MKQARNADGTIATREINPGDKFNMLTAVEFAGRRGHNRTWRCKCDCGIEVVVLASNLRSGNSKSCGCHKRKVSRASLFKHGKSDTSVFYVWSNMVRRCHSPSNRAYRNYGARGITVCDRWRTFENFYADMGDRPEGLTLERIDNKKGYSPENCRWATRKEQGRNRRGLHKIPHEGRLITANELAEIAGMPAARIHARIKLGWPTDKLTLPIHSRIASQNR